MTPVTPIHRHSIQPALVRADLFSQYRVSAIGDNRARPVIRPMVSADGPLQDAFFSALSHQARFDRFMGATKGVSPSMLRVLSDFHAGMHEAFMAWVTVNGSPIMVAEARFVRDAPRSPNAEFAIAVADSWQRRGLARKLMTTIEYSARKSGIQRLTGITLKSNRSMLTLSRSLGYSAHLHPSDGRSTRLMKSLVPASSDHWNRECPTARAAA